MLASIHIYLKNVAKISKLQMFRCGCVTVKSAHKNLFFQHYYIQAHVFHESCYKTEKSI